MRDMTDQPSKYYTLEVVCLAALALTAGCMNPWESTEYRAVGLVTEAPEGATVVSHTDSEIYDNQIIQQVVAEAIVAYENRTGTPESERRYDAGRQVTQDQYQDTTSLINELDSYSGDDDETSSDAAIYIRRAGYVVKVWTIGMRLV